MVNSVEKGIRASAALTVWMHLVMFAIDEIKHLMKTVVNINYCNKNLNLNSSTVQRISFFELSLLKGSKNKKRITKRLQIVNF